MGEMVDEGVNVELVQRVPDAVVEGRGMEVMEGKWLVKSLKQSGRKGIRMYFCETKVELGK